MVAGQRHADTDAVTTMPLDPSDIVTVASSAITGAVGWLTGRRRARAEVEGVEASVSQAQGAAWMQIVDTQRQLGEDMARIARESRAAEAACLERADALARALEAGNERAEALARALDEERITRRSEVRAVLARVGVRPTPSTGHSTVIAPIDPLAETPPDGHRLVAPAIPRRDDPDPTPDLPSSLTPSRAKTDPPA